MENNKQNTSNNRTEGLGFSLGPLRTWATGSKPLKVLGWGMFITLGGYGIYRLFNYFGNRGDSRTSQEEHTHNTNDRINLEDAKSTNTINEHHEASRDAMAVDDNRTDNHIREAQALSDIRMNERKQVMELRQSKKFATNVPAKDNVSLREWINSFHARYPMPDYSSIQFLAPILDACPSGFEDAMLMSLLSECGALCFSKVRALYLDGNQHSPSIQVVVEGEHGSGKGKILDLYERLFSRVIDADNEKLSRTDVANVILQTAGINISRAKFYEIMANNHEVHIFALESESATVLDTFKKANGLSFDYLRKAFSNERIYQNNMMRHSPNGSFLVYFNYVFTGTPDAITVLFNRDEVEGGTASRICFAIIPEVGRMAPFMVFPSGNELDIMRDQIDSWRQQYCYQTVDGIDTACPEYEIELDYVCKALQDWQDEQCDRSVQEGVKERTSERMRMAAIAFNCAIVLHMLAGEPQSKDIKLRRTVKELAVYIANYCMERYLSKFSDYLPQTQNVETHADESNLANPTPERRPLTNKELFDWYYLRGTYDDDGKVIGYGYIAKELGVDIDSVKNSFRRFKKNKGMI